MANIEITNNSPNGFVIWEPVFEDNTLTSSGAVTWPAGTILGRITADSKLTAYDPGAGDGSEVPVAILHDETEFTAAGDLAIRALINGRVRAGDLTVVGQGVPTIAQIDALRDYGIVALNVQQLAELDNQ